MIVRRWKVPWITTKGDELLDLLKEFRDLFPGPHATRIYRPMLAQHGKFIVEHEFESMRELGDWIDEVWSKVPAKDFWEKYDVVTETDQSFEIWRLVD
jgi:hypothetical protein